MVDITRVIEQMTLLSSLSKDINSQSLQATNTKLLSRKA